ncbi:hypothetical protein DdX_05635 [Ditylenchus destructor]|uniref:Abnormal cell migration protein 18-like fibronectin type I domain-containing protein n=1 Tax=Ditylenchus destructor TaxID=166010 RepID=A0AAD4R9Z9_9BILA|nr:hypothetical protein DdX_05635 [Ditylenchus destructor]
MKFVKHVAIFAAFGILYSFVFLRHLCGAVISEEKISREKEGAERAAFSSASYGCQAAKSYWKEVMLEGEINGEGCSAFDDSRLLQVGDRIDFDGYSYECQKNYEGKIHLCPVGCIVEGHRYRIGEQWMDGEFVYYCKYSGQKCQKICIGCQFRDQRLYNGDRYRRDDTTYQCVVRPNRSIHKPVGCVADGVERVVGCKWRTTKRDTKIEETCVVRKSRSIVESTGCIYTSQGYDIFFLNPNTYTVWKQFLDGKPIGVVCRRSQNTESSLLLETFDMEDLDRKTAGLKYDEPRG